MASSRPNILVRRYRQKKYSSCASSSSQLTDALPQRCTVFSPPLFSLSHHPSPQPHFFNKKKRERERERARESEEGKKRKEVLHAPLFTRSVIIIATDAAAAIFLPDARYFIATARIGVLLVSTEGNICSDTMTSMCCLCSSKFYC